MWSSFKNKFYITSISKGSSWPTSLRGNFTTTHSRIKCHHLRTTKPPRSYSSRQPRMQPLPTKICSKVPQFLLKSLNVARYVSAYSDHLTLALKCTRIVVRVHESQLKSSSHMTVTHSVSSVDKSSPSPSQPASSPKRPTDFKKKKQELKLIDIAEQLKPERKFSFMEKAKQKRVNKKKPNPNST